MLWYSRLTGSFQEGSNTDRAFGIRSVNQKNTVQSDNSASICGATS